MERASAKDRLGLPLEKRSRKNASSLRSDAADDATGNAGRDSDSGQLRGDAAGDTAGSTGRNSDGSGQGDDGRGDVGDLGDGTALSGSSAARRSTGGSGHGTLHLAEQTADQTGDLAENRGKGELPLGELVGVTLGDSALEGGSEGFGLSGQSLQSSELLGWELRLSDWSGHGEGQGGGEDGGDLHVCGRSLIGRCWLVV